MKPKQIFIYSTIFVGFALLIAGLFMFGGTKTATAEINPLTLPGINMNQELVFEGDSVSFEDSKVSITVSPAISNEPIISFTSKVYSGEIDLIVGFDTDEVVPTGAGYNPHLEDIEKSYSCNGQNNYFNYTTSPKHFWCWNEIITYDNETNITNGSYFYLIYEHDFETGDLESGIAYWIEEETIWNSVSDKFTVVNYDYKGFNKWYYVKGFDINANQKYQLKLSLQPKGFLSSKKYFFGVKPSNETLQEAITKGHFYYIDPWTEDLNVDILSYYKFDGDVTDELNINNGADSGTTDIAGIIDRARDFDGINDYIQYTNPLVLSGTINFWMDGNFVSTTRDVISARNSGNNNNRILLRWDTDNNFYYNLWSSSGAQSGGTFADSNVPAGLSMITLFYENNHFEVLVNTVSVFNDTSGTAPTGSVEGGYQLGRDRSNSFFYDGIIDEFGVWDEILSAAQITQLYNGGVGITYTGDFDVDCQFAGFVKDEAGGALEGANITIFNQFDVTEFYEDTTDSNGAWAINITNSTNTYMSAAYFNNTLIGQLKPYVVGTC